MTQSKYVCRYLLWVLESGYMPYHMGFHVPWVYMSKYVQFGHISYFLCAPRAELLKKVFLCFGPQPMFMKRLKALGCFHAKA